jgi:hypothetical protein
MASEWKRTPLSVAINRLGLIIIERGACMQKWVDNVLETSPDIYAAAV